MSMTDEVLSQLQSDIQTASLAFKADLAKLRTGRASLSILDGVRVNYYGVPTPLNQCANMAVADARMLTVKPWEKNLIGEIEKAIREANLGINPQNDGDLIRLPIPALTQDRRKDLVKQAKGRAEDAKISMRNHRRDANEMLKEMEKEKEISQDDLKKALERVQEMVDEGSTQIDQVLAQKEKEIMEI